MKNQVIPEQSQKFNKSGAVITSTLLALVFSIPLFVLSSFISDTSFSFITYILSFVLAGYITFLGCKNEMEYKQGVSYAPIVYFAITFILPPIGCFLFFYDLAKVKAVRNGLDLGIYTKKNTSPLLAFLWSFPVSFFLFFISAVIGTGHNSTVWMQMLAMALLIIAFLLPFIVLFSAHFKSSDTSKTSSVGQDSLIHETTSDTQPQKLSVSAKIFLWIAVGFLFIFLLFFFFEIALFSYGTPVLSILGFIIALSIFTFLKEFAKKDVIQSDAKQIETQKTPLNL